MQKQSRCSPNGVGLQIFQRNKLECVNVRGFEHDLWSHAGLERLDPARHAQAPPVTGLQSGKIILGHGRGEIISHRAAEGEKLFRRHNTNGMQALVIGAGAAITVAVKSRHGIAAAALQGLAKNIAGHKYLSRFVVRISRVTERICRKLQAYGPNNRRNDWRSARKLSECAPQTSVMVVRAFVRLRQLLSSKAELARKLEAMEKKYDSQFKVVFDAIRQLMSPPETKRKEIGFHVKHEDQKPKARKRRPPRPARQLHHRGDFQPHED
jgi:hypothetical protein